MSEEGRKLIDKLMEVVSGQPLGAVREAVVNLMAALIISDADTEEQMEQALEDLGVVLDHTTREHWKAACRGHKRRKGRRQGHRGGIPRVVFGLRRRLRDPICDRIFALRPPGDRPSLRGHRRRLRLPPRAYSSQGGLLSDRSS